MQKYIDKYFNWLDIKNEGIRRIILIIHPIAMIFMFISTEPVMVDDFAIALAILTPIFTTAIIKCSIWIKQGFDKDTIYD